MGLNINGDIIGNCVEKSDKSKIKTDMLNKLEINGVLPSDVKKLLDEFISYCGNNKIKVIVTFPAYYMPFKELKDGQYIIIDEITQFWLQWRDVVLLSTFIDNIYDVNDFYDGNYHMNDGGRIKQTSQLIKELEFEFK